MKNTIYCFLVYLCIIALSSRAKAQGAGYTLQFDGVNDYVEVAANASLNITSAITIEAWVKQIYQCAVGKCNDKRKAVVPN